MGRDMSEFWRLVSTRPLPRIHVLSDLHLETGPYVIPPDLDYDILVTAGDIGPVEKAIEWLAALGKPVIYVLGNHEYWGREYADVLPAARAAARGTQVRVLERGTAIIRGVRFVGATLWTDFGSWHPDLVRQASWRMRDYSQITARQWYDTKANRAWFQRQCRHAALEHEGIEQAIAEGRFHPAITYQLHRRSLIWLRRALQRRFDGPTVVVTHHAPTFQSLRAFGVREELLHPANWGWRDDSLFRVAAYASNLDGFLKDHADGIDLWVHGHLHRGMDMLTPGVRVLCNPRGYAQKLLDEESARELELFGHRVTEKTIGCSQALFREQAYRGDAPNFDSQLVVDLERGYERPIRLQTGAPLRALRELTEDVAELVSRLRRTRGANRQYLIRCMNHDLDKFNATIDACLAGITPSLLRCAWDGLDGPFRPWGPLQGTPDDPEEFYSGSLDLMKAWEAWLDALPGLAQAQMTEWAHVSRGILAMLAEAGVDGKIVKLPTTALRRLDGLEHRVVVAQDEERREEWCKRLDEAFSGGIPRKHLIWVWRLADLIDSERARLLTLQDLERFFRSSPAVDHETQISEDHR